MHTMTTEKGLDVVNISPEVTAKYLGYRMSSEYDGRVTQDGRMRGTTRGEVHPNARARSAAMFANYQCRALVLGPEGTRHGEVQCNS